MIVAIVAVGTAIGFVAGARRRMDLEQWTVGGRGFGTVLVFLLMAGEVYTTFAFLGISGWAYSRGGPALYALAYLSLAYVAAFFFLPQLWELGRKHHMQTQADFFGTVYRNPYLAGFVCLVGILAFVPYIQLQLAGIGIIVSVASFGHIGRIAAMSVGTILIVAFVFAHGVRAVACGEHREGPSDARSRRLPSASAYPLRISEVSARRSQHWRTRGPGIW